MLFHKIVGDFLVAGVGLDAFGDHGLVRDEQQCAGGDFVVKTGAENGGGLHIHRHAADAAQIFFEFFVVLPHTAVGGVDGAGPVIALVVADDGRKGFLQTERGQRGDFRRKIIVGGAFAPDGGNGQDEVADLVFAFEPAAFTEKEAGLGFDGGEQVHDGGGGGAAHAEVDDGDALGGGVGHETVFTAHRDVVPLGEEADVIGEIDEEDVLAEFCQRCAGVARQPVRNDVVLGLHLLPSDSHPFCRERKEKKRPFRNLTRRPKEREDAKI